MTTIRNIKLSNPQDFKIKSAYIQSFNESYHRLVINLTTLLTSEWISKTERGAKMIFSREYSKKEYGRIAEWEIFE